MKLKSIGEMFGVALLLALVVALPCVEEIFWLYALSSLSILWFIVFSIVGNIVFYIALFIVGIIFDPGSWFSALITHNFSKLVSTIFVALVVALEGFYLYNCSWISCFAEVSTLRVVWAVMDALFLLVMIAEAFFAIWKPESFRAFLEESKKKED